MTDLPTIIQTIGAGVGIGQSLFQLLGFAKGVAGSDMIAAYFSWDGTRLHGSDLVEVVRLPDERPNVWWFTVKDVRDYVFARFAVGGTAEEFIGKVKGEENADARFWRWLAPSRSGTIIGEVGVNLKIEFVVVGYKPKALVDHFAARR
jgi:hypothetical protein